MLFWRTWIVAAVAALPLVTAQPASAESWVQYVNKKYSFSVCYPEDLFHNDIELNKQIREEEGDTGDTSEDSGLRLDAPDHNVSLVVYGEEMTQGSGVVDERNHLEAQIPYTAHIVSRTNETGLYIEATTADNFRILYRGTYDRRFPTVFGNGVFKVLELKYPANDADFAAAATRIMSCFRG